MNEQSSYLPQGQTSGMIGEQRVYERPKKRASSCGCNKRNNQSISSNNVKRQKVHSLQNNKVINQQRQVTNHHTPIMKQDNSTPIKSIFEEKVSLSPKGT